MKRLPSREEILALLDRLDQDPADALESDQLDFKRWQDPRTSMSEAIAAAVCFANADGGVLVFGVKDRVTGRGRTITGPAAPATTWTPGNAPSTTAPGPT